MNRHEHRPEYRGGPDARRATVDGGRVAGDGERAAVDGVDREQAFVELVDGDGRAVGRATVAAAHRAPGQLHRAFSVVLLDAGGRLLLQQRAAGKTRFPLRWANACCGHPGPGEAVVPAASRRLREELGLVNVTLTGVGVYVYQAADPVTGRVEHEYDHVLLGRIDRDELGQPDPTEVAALRWVHVDDLVRELVTAPDSYAPWLAGVVAAWRAHEPEPAGDR